MCCDHWNPQLEIVWNFTHFEIWSNNIVENSVYLDIQSNCMDCNHGYRFVHAIIIWWRYMSVLARPNHRQLDCLCNSLLGLKTKRASRLVPLGPCEGNPPMAGKFPSHRARDAETFLCHDNDGEWRRNNGCNYHIGATIGLANGHQGFNNNNRLIDPGDNISWHNDRDVMINTVSTDGLTSLCSSMLSPTLRFGNWFWKKRVNMI